MKRNRRTLVSAVLLAALLPANAITQVMQSQQDKVRANNATPSTPQANIVELLKRGTAADRGGDRQQSLTCYEQALTLARTIGDRTLEAQALANIGNVYVALSEQQQALAYYQQALEIFRATGNHSGEAATLSGIGHVYSIAGRRREALRFFEQSLPVQRALRDDEGEANTLNKIAVAYDNTVDRNRQEKPFTD